MPKWSTKIELMGEENMIRIPIKFMRGLFQEDSLFPLLFCLYVVPVSRK